MAATKTRPKKSRVGSTSRTMFDVARRAGVSVKTVSRVVNGEQGVSESTRLRVTRFIEQLGYYPHKGARSLRTEPRDCIGVTIPAPVEQVPVRDTFFVRLFEAFYRIYGKQGKYLIFDLNPYRKDTHICYARGLWEQRYWGCVLCGPLKLGDTTLVRIHNSGQPYLAMGRLDSLPDCSSATVDYAEASRLSVAHLVESGHTRIGLLRGFEGFQSGVDRERGYLEGIEAAGFAPDPRLVKSTKFSKGDVTAKVHQLLSDTSVTAVIDASGSENAEEIREGCSRAGRVLGRDVELLPWTYTANACVLREAAAHVWLPVWEAAVDGLEQFSSWFSGENSGPVQVMYKPILSRANMSEEMPAPVTLFGPRD
ncbi:MAG: LacI family transcriptional regulator [Candidatus Hydrogenedentes bacterium]|nr:LacI family transcriptional regulator [Candidatus Hydrogenedentota bacterium]